MLFPLRDENPTRRVPIATFIIIAINALVWAIVQGFGSDASLALSFCRFGLIPGELLGLVADGTPVRFSESVVCRLGETSAFTLVTSMFMHGSWLHLIGNMWFLWVFGDNIEDRMGPIRFIVFYVLAGLVASGAQIATDIDSTVPVVGASGAIGGVLGAYLLLYPRSRILTFVFLGLFFTTTFIPAAVILLFWFAIQLLSGLPMLIGDTGAGIAFWAHIGGFVTGLLLVYVFIERTSFQEERAE